MKYVYETVEEIKALPNNCIWAPIKIEVKYPGLYGYDVWGEGFIKQEDGLHHPDGDVDWDELEDLFDSDERKVYAIRVTENMRVEFKKVEKVEINMDELMVECITRLDWRQKRAEQGRYAPDYENLESLVQESLEFLYDIEEPYEYYNASEVIALIAENLLIWCLEYNFIEEHDRLKEMC